MAFVLIAGSVVPSPTFAQDAPPEAPAAPAPDTAPPAPPEPVSAAEAKAAWEKLKAIEGEWIGKSTKGWTETSTWRLIAGGSALMENSFDAHPGESMVTFIHPDGDRLILTHYCMAKNQPRMMLTSVTEEGTYFDFTFLDATNLKSRDKGHMDRCRVKLNADGTFTEQWTWYQKGTESWMEVIEYKRKETPPTIASAKQQLAGVQRELATGFASLGQDFEAKKEDANALAAYFRARESDPTYAPAETAHRTVADRILNEAKLPTAPHQWRTDMYHWIMQNSFESDEVHQTAENELGLMGVRTKP